MNPFPSNIEIEDAVYLSLKTYMESTWRYGVLFNALVSFNVDTRPRVVYGTEIDRVFLVTWGVVLELNSFADKRSEFYLLGRIMGLKGAGFDNPSGP
jgi:hypothetical protein